MQEDHANYCENWICGVKIDGFLKAFIESLGRFGITFPQYSKIDVNGEIVARFEPTADVKKIADRVKEIL